MHQETEIIMHVPEDYSTGQYRVIQFSEFTYKLLENDPFNMDFSYGTVVEVKPEFKIENGEKVFTFKRIYKESDYSIEVYGLPHQLNETELRTIGDKIMKEGGLWEVIFGGMCYVNLPKDSKLDVIEEVNKVIREKNRKLL